MNFFRFCRRNLTALPVFLALAACNHWTGFSPEAQKGSGKLVSVKIGAISVAGGAQNETVTRARGNERRIVGGPIIRDLGGGTLAEITVEEDLSALRDDSAPQPLGSGRKFRVIAIDATTKKLYSYADYAIPSTMPQNGEISPEAGELHVLDGSSHSYDFICVSYNSATDLPPDEEYKEGQELPLLSASVSKDIFYWRQEAQTVGSNFSLNIVLSPQFVKVKLKLDWNSAYNTGWYISGVNATGGIGIGAAASSGSFNLATGDFSASGNLSFSGWTSSGTGASTVWESATLTFIPGTASPSLSFSREVIALSASDLPGPYSIPTPPVGTQQTLATGSALEKGKNYLLHLSFRIPKFASSNIYWDDSDEIEANHRLTFMPYRDNQATFYAGQQQYQGVFFRFGSLVGVSPAGSAYGAGTPIYVPNYDLADPTSCAWTPTNAEAQGWVSWSDIPHLEPAPAVNQNRDDRSVINLAESNWPSPNYLGDICQLISKTQNLGGDYRLPTSSEFGSSSSSVSWSPEAPTDGWKREDGNTGETWESSVVSVASPENHAGKFCIGHGGRFGPTGNFFPASGGMSNTGNQAAMGSHGYSRCGGASSNSGEYVTYFGEENVNPGGTGAIGGGRPVRCVMN